MGDVFQRVNVFHRNQGGTVVTWDLDPIFVSSNPGPMQFELLVSLSGAGNWEVADAVVDNNWAQDPSKRVYPKWPRLSYQVQVTTSGGEVYSSRVKQATGNFYGGDHGIVSAIIRKENLALRQKTGACGWLYKRRHWGDPCTNRDCVSYDTGEVTPQEDCLLCYQTGFLGGYFDPIEYWFGQSAKSGPEHRRLETKDKYGLTDQAISFRRGIACPWLDTNDVWVDFDSDERYYLQRIWPVEFRNVPIIYDPVELRLVRMDEIVYKLPRPDESAVPS